MYTEDGRVHGTVMYTADYSLEELFCASRPYGVVSRPGRAYISSGRAYISFGRPKDVSFSIGRPSFYTWPQAHVHMAAGATLSIFGARIVASQYRAFCLAQGHNDYRKFRIPWTTR